MYKSKLTKPKKKSAQICNLPLIKTIKAFIWPFDQIPVKPFYKKWLIPKDYELVSFWIIITDTIVVSQ